MADFGYWQLCTNLYYLAKRSTTKTSEGIKIVTLGGQLDETIIGGLSKEKYLPFHTVGDAKALYGANTADILLTACWPASIRAGSKVALPDGTSEPAGLEHIADLCAHLKPKYHFSTSSNLFYEREPFFHMKTEESPNPRLLTRFISLAAHGNAKKQKSLYAFSLQPSAEPPATLPPGTTASPFSTRPSKRRAALDPEPYTRFGGDTSSHHHNKRGRRDRQPPPGPGECFFCLANPNLATHLICSIGDEAYLTTAKGPLTTSTTNASSGLDFPGHVLLIPLAHTATLGLIPDLETRGSTHKEMERYKGALQTMVSRRSGDKIGAVTYEVSRAGGIHTHWQFLPVPGSLIRKGLVEAAFRVEAENLKYPPFQTRDPGVGETDGDFFRVWIWASPCGEEEETAKCLMLPMDDSFRFDLQFGRRVLAKLLGLEKRLQWKDCAQDEEEEKMDVKRFNDAFKEFNPSS